MENKKNLTFPCFIGTTKYSAGIFLSRKIAARQKYAQHLRLEEFPNFDQASEEFFSRYPQLANVDDFNANRIYKVKEEPFYAVFWTLEHVVITIDDDNYDKLEILLPDDWNSAWSKGHLTYEEAQNFAAIRFARIYRNPALCIRGKLRINVPVSLSTVKHTKKRSRTGY